MCGLLFPSTWKISMEHLSEWDWLKPDSVKQKFNLKNPIQQHQNLTKLLWIEERWRSQSQKTNLTQSLGSQENSPFPSGIQTSRGHFGSPSEQLPVLGEQTSGSAFKTPSLWTRFSFEGDSPCWSYGLKWIIFNLSEAFRAQVFFCCSRWAMNI